ncbi:MAG: hypothetical protein CFE26_02755 [Verrucomicrobiales bacterium VVV1]|nr:MAG: hypothetical protein CFE26_02755 [Verrucomicrobiales bacterium VVV1]
MIALLLLAAALLLLLWKKPVAAPVSTVSVDSLVSPRKERVSIPEAKVPSSDRSREVSSRSGERRDDVLQEIQSAVITYAPEGVKPISDHLLDSDPEIREAARQGLVQLGEAGAIPILREAARQLDETEAKACLEAASFLELPSWSLTEEARAISTELSKPTPDP